MKKNLRKKIIFAVAALAAIALVAGACNHSDDSTSSAAATTAAGNNTATTVASTSQPTSILQQVRDRDSVRCGSRDNLPGFGEIDSSGRNTGFDVDFCRVIAAAVLGDASKVEFVILGTPERFTALQSGRIDVLVRNTTWTASRDGTEGANFVFTTYYDGQGIMVPASSSVTRLEDLQDATICVASGTTTEKNLTSVFAQRNISFNPSSFEDTDNLQPAYESGQCEAWTSDISQLTSFKLKIEDAGGDDQRILQEVISKEPLGPAVPDGDSEWAQVVRWAVMAPVQAWEFGITRANVNTFANQAYDDSPNIARFLGKNSDGGTLDTGLGLSADFAVNVISQVGNYEEIYTSNIRGLPLSGSVNDLWSNGGLMYTPPYR